jgi:hypothetical protein
VVEAKPEWANLVSKPAACTDKDKKNAYNRTGSYFFIN